MFSYWDTNTYVCFIAIAHIGEEFVVGPDMNYACIFIGWFDSERTSNKFNSETGMRESILFCLVYQNCKRFLVNTLSLLSTNLVMPEAIHSWQSTRLLSHVEKWNANCSTFTCTYLNQLHPWTGTWSTSWVPRIIDQVASLVYNYVFLSLWCRVIPENPNIFFPPNHVLVYCNMNVYSCLDIFSRW